MVAEEETAGIAVVDGVEGSGGVELEAKFFDAFAVFDVVGIFEFFEFLGVFDLDDEVPALTRSGDLSAAVDGLLNRWGGLDDLSGISAVDGLLNR